MLLMQSTNTTTDPSSSPGSSGMEALAWAGMAIFLTASVLSTVVFFALKRLRRYGLVSLLCYVFCLVYLFLTKDDFVFTRSDQTRINALVVVLNAFVWYMLLNIGLVFLQVPQHYWNELRTVGGTGVLFTALSAFCGHSIRYGNPLSILLIIIVLGIMALSSTRLRQHAPQLCMLWLAGLCALGLLYGMAALLSHSFTGALGLAKALIFHFFTHVATVVFVAFSCHNEPVATAPVRFDASDNNNNNNNNGQHAESFTPSLTSDIDDLVGGDGNNQQDTMLSSQA